MDPRIKVALVAFNKIEALEKSNKLKGNIEPLRHAIMSLKWIEDLEYLKLESKKIAELNYNYRFDKKSELLIKWCIEIFQGLPKRLDRPGKDSILLGLDCGLGTILSLRHLEHNLSVCTVDSKLGQLTVITNMKVKKGDSIPFCLLPPAEFQGIESEAMFVSGPVDSLSEVNWQSVEGKVSSVLEL